MLVLRPAQVAALCAAVETAFEDEVAAELRERFPANVAELTGDELRRRIAEGIAIARAQELTSRADLKAFALLRFVVAPWFHLHPIVSGLLETLAIPREARLAAVLDRLRGGLGAEIRASALAVWTAPE